MVPQKPLDIMQENILRVIYEETSRSNTMEKVKELSQEPNVVAKKWNLDFDQLFQDSIYALQTKNLIQLENGIIILSENGILEAKEIFSRHLMIEECLLRDYDSLEAHRAAHILEHNISKEVLSNMKRISQLENKGMTLPELFNFGEGIIISIKLDNPQLFERMIAMGICPGQKIIVLAKIIGGFVVKLGNTQIALDNSICQKIKVMMR